MGLLVVKPVSLWHDIYIGLELFKQIFDRNGHFLAWQPHMSQVPVGAPRHLPGYTLKRPRTAASSEIDHLSPRHAPTSTNTHLWESWRIAKINTIQRAHTCSCVNRHALWIIPETFLPNPKYDMKDQEDQREVPIEPLNLARIPKKTWSQAWPWAWIVNRM